MQMAPTPDSEETRLEPMIVPGGVGAQTRAAALAQFESQSEQDSFTVYPVSAQARPRNAPRRRQTHWSGKMKCWRDC